MPANPLPRWRGFNLLEKFHAAPGGKRYGALTPFRENDFQWISDWGFNFVRLPMSYRIWTRDDTPDGPYHEGELAQIDHAVEMGRRHGIHVCINLHRAPGYCVNLPEEPTSLWTDAATQDAFVQQWKMFARRYRGTPAADVSFDLLNEPPRPGERNMVAEDYLKLVRRTVAAIHAIDPERTVIADGMDCGNQPMPELNDVAVAQSCRGYIPMSVSHHGATWVDMPEAEPQWPGGDHFGEKWDRKRLKEHYGRWAALTEQGVGVHCGECGGFNRTPHEVFLAWLEDLLEVLQGYGIGWALWNFRGSFGVLDSRRADVTYESWREHELDRKLLELLQAH